MKSHSPDRELGGTAPVLLGSVHRARPTARSWCLFVASLRLLKEKHRMLWKTYEGLEGGELEVMRGQLSEGRALDLDGGSGDRCGACPLMGKCGRWD